MFRSVVFVFIFCVFSLSHAGSFCNRATTFISELPFICTSRQEFSDALLADGYEFQRSIGSKDVYFSSQTYELPATMVSLFNDKNELLMAQYIFSGNTSGNAYKVIRQKIDEIYGAHKRSRGKELDARFEYVWYMKDGVRIRFQRKKGSSEARLTFNLPHKTKAFLRRQKVSDASVGL